MKPYLRDVSPVNYEEIPEATVYEAGYLVTKNAGWRNIRPVVNTEKCKGCLHCYLYCPDGVISKDKTKRIAIFFNPSTNSYKINHARLEFYEFDISPMNSEAGWFMTEYSSFYASIDLALNEIKNEIVDFDELSV